MTTPSAIYVWLVPSEHVQEQPGSWRIRKWDIEPFPEANFALESRDAIIEQCASIADREWIGENSLIGSRVAGTIARAIRKLQSSSTATRVLKRA
jgi:hypothetical protein